MEGEHKLKFLVTIRTFAERKGVSKQAVQYHLGNGNIKATFIGSTKEIFIDWRKYKEFEFSESKTKQKGKDQ